MISGVRKTIGALANTKPELHFVSDKRKSFLQFGEQLSGNLKIVFPRPLHTTSLVAKLEGFVRVKYTISSGKNAIEYYKKHTLIELEKVLYSSKQKRQFFPKPYNFSLKFDVPDNLLPSIETTHSNGNNKVNYRLKVYTDQENWLTDTNSYSCPLLFYPSDKTTTETLQKGSFVSQIKERKFFKQLSVHCQVVIESNTVPVNDKIVGGVKLSGNVDKFPQYVDVQLVQYQWSKGDPHSWLSFKHSCNARLVLKEVRKNVEIKDGEALLYFEIETKADNDSDLRLGPSFNSEFLSISYELQVLFPFYWIDVFRTNMITIPITVTGPFPKSLEQMPKVA